MGSFPETSNDPRNQWLQEAGNCGVITGFETRKGQNF